MRDCIGLSEDRIASRLGTRKNYGGRSRAQLAPGAAGNLVPDSKGAFPMYPGDTRRKPDGSRVARALRIGNLVSPASLHSVKGKSTKF
jgi:hypothetical protein